MELSRINVTWADYNEELEENLDKLITRLKRKSFKPIPAKRVYIPKNEKEKRPLGISALENKIDKLIMSRPVNHVVEADIRKFFDKVSHEELIKFIKIRIRDTSLLILIEKFLKAGYIDDGLLVRTEEGTPQGSILSPILANIFLHYVYWMNGLKKWLKKIRNKEKTKEWWKTLRAKLNGHFQYYGVSGNFRGIANYYKITIRLVHKWLNRRSQKRKMNWENFYRYLTHYPLPCPQIRHNFYTLSA
ncbi:MAG: hypothetical protein DRJ01_13955 [Bacteroidetes bacterium]|nr:MAG: hypothetical protein DRJ01_13955 [Bacteroidota bacterium]